MDEEYKTTRRAFIAKSAAAATGVSLGLSAFGAPTVRPVLGANDKVRVGFIGVGNRGSQLLRQFMANDDVEVAALCDVYEPYIRRDRAMVHPDLLSALGGQVPRMGETFGNDVGRYKDFRSVLERDDIDAVCIATPDHWHALQTIAAIDAGKDVYVEKPLTITLHEGRNMVGAAERSDRVVAVGLNRRGLTVYQRLAKEIPAGKIGMVTLARAYRISNMYPDGIGRALPSDPPPGLDWDFWLGPRAYRPYQGNITPYKFRWWKSYSSQMGNWGVHFMDVIRWMLGEKAPIAISAHGSKYLVNDDRTIPDTMEVTFEFKSGAIGVFGIYEASGGTMIDGGEVEFRGAKGNLITSMNGYKVTPSGSGQFQEWEQLVEPVEWEVEPREDSTAILIRDFLDCVKSRGKPICTLEDGHRSTSFAHLANIALEVGGRIEWDAESERITNNEPANDLLRYEYRSPWRL